MNTYAKLALASAAVIAVGTVGLAMLRPDPTTSGDRLEWTPARLAQDWPGPVRSEPGSAPVVYTMRHGERTHWDEGGWEGLEFPDPMGDVPSNLPWLDVVEVGLSPQGAPTFRLTVAGADLDPMAEPTARWIAYGMVLDTDADGAADLRIGIDNMPTAEHRAWRTDLSTGVTLSKAGSPYGMVGGDQSGRGGPRVGLDTWYAGEPDVGRDAIFRYSLQEGEQEYRFYAWASMIEDGRVVATDFAPDAGWLEEGDQPELSLVGPTWNLETVITGDDVSGLPDTLGSTLDVTDDGGFIIDGGTSSCGLRGGSLIVGPDDLRVTGLFPTQRACPGEAAWLDSALMSVWSAGEVSFTIDKGVLQLRAGTDGLRYQGQYPPDR